MHAAAAPAAALEVVLPTSARQRVHERLYSYIPNDVYVQTLGELNPEVRVLLGQGIR